MSIVILISLLFNNLSLWGNVGVQLGDKGYSDTQGMLGVKYSW
ncbi:TPA: autotransporter outer membrane beta-barrel domain-containing protein [Escherichia coli]|nr:autotransporter outer membrane beta-barrel domain-containing protein [Escherichia coli]